jgi:multiple sugar transport system substrate-binding protein
MSGALPIDRRTLLKLGIATAAGAAAGPLAEILAARRAPAIGQVPTLHLLHGISFVPEGDAELRRQIAEYHRQAGVVVRLETININDLQARITAAIEAQSGADIIAMAHNWPHLYQRALADVSDLCEWKASEQGGYYPVAEAAARENGRWLALPLDIVGLLIAYRKSWFAEAGAPEPPRTLDEYRRLGARLKRRGRPIGQTLGHTLGDAPAWAYPLLWAFGAAETDPSGKRVVLDSKGARESVEWMTAFWREAGDEGALAWDDTNNNRAFHAGEISATLNGASIYIYAKRNPDKILDEHGQPMVRDISHFAIPAGTVPTPGYHVPVCHALMGYSRNQRAAKEFLRWLHGKEQFGKWFEVQEGYSVGATRVWQQHPVWARVDAAMRPYRTAANASRMFGYAGPSGARAAEVYSKFILVDMYAKAVQGMSPAEAVRWASDELRGVYGG